MENLNNTTILIGKEPEQGRLLIAIQGTNRYTRIGTPHSVPLSVSRCKPAEGVAHAKISIDSNGQMSIVNMKPQNVTYVNGNEIEKKHIDTTSRVELGDDHYRIDLVAILDAVKSMLQPNIISDINTPIQHNQGQTKEYRVSHLKVVWDCYEKQISEIQERQRQQAINAKLPMFFTIGSGAISSLAIRLCWPSWVIFLCIGMTIVGLIVMLITYVNTKNDTSLADKKKALDEFQDNYICPNPECRKSLPQVSYKILRRNYQYCPYCKCKFID